MEGDIPIPPEQGNGRAPPAIRKVGLPPPEIYGRLELMAPIRTSNGAEASEVIVYRPTAGIMTHVLETLKQTTQIERFVDGCCRAVNGGDTPLPFSANQLYTMDSVELQEVIGAMSEDADKIMIDEGGDGITSPIIYTLQKPIKMTPQNPETETVEQFQFEARKVGDLSEFLDAVGETKTFYTFMRLFGKPLGLRIPIMTDILIGAIDFVDYLVIRRQIMGKFMNSRKRWKRESLRVH